MSYADGEYPTCTHEAHLTRDDLERWWVRVTGAAEISSPAHAADGTKCWCAPEVVYQDGSHPTGPCLPGDALEVLLP